MCELFGLCSNESVGISFSWRGFVRRGTIHRSGWGVGWYVKNERGERYAALVKEPRPSIRSLVAELLKKGIRSSIVISHVRLATEGDPKYVNTHPFVRPFGRDEWIFAHNGDVSGIKGSRLVRYHPVGDTDSEYAFCYILDKLPSNVRLRDLFKMLFELAQEIADYGTFNFLMSNSRYLFAHTSNGRLHYLLRHPPHTGKVRIFGDEDYQVSLEEVKRADEYAALLATVPLTDENWMRMEREKLYVFRDGDLVLVIDSNGFRPMLSDKELEILRVVRTAPSSLRLSEIADCIGGDIRETYRIVRSLVHRGYLKQHSHDRVKPNHPEARYFTRKNKRALIEILLNSAEI